MLTSFYTDVNNLVQLLLNNNFNDSTTLDSDTDLLHLYKLFIQWRLNPLSIFATVLVTVDNYDTITAVKFPKQIADNNYMIINRHKSCLANYNDIIENNFVIMSTYSYLDNVLCNGFDMLTKYPVKVNTTVKTLQKLIKLLNRQNVKIGTFDYSKIKVANNTSIIKNSNHKYLYVVSKKMAVKLGCDNLDGRNYFKKDNDNDTIQRVALSNQQPNNQHLAKTDNYSDNKNNSNSTKPAIFTNILDEIANSDNVAIAKSNMINMQSIYSNIYSIYEDLDFNEEVTDYYTEKKTILKRLNRCFDKLTTRKNQYLLSIADIVKSNMSDIEFGATEEQLHTIFGNTRSKSLNIIRKALEYVPSTWIESVSNYLASQSTTLKLYTLKDNCRSSYDSDTFEFHIRPRLDDAIHEFMHVIEKASNTVIDEERTFFKHRTKNCPLSKISWLSNKELFRKDNFNETYFGKDYYAMCNDNQSFELLSLGMEYLFTNPQKLDKENAELINWLLTVINNTSKHNTHSNQQIKPKRKIVKLTQQENTFKIISKQYFIAVAQFIEEVFNKLKFDISYINYNTFSTNISILHNNSLLKITITPNYDDLTNPIITMENNTYTLSEWINLFHKTNFQKSNNLFRDRFLANTLQSIIYNKLDDTLSILSNDETNLTLRIDKVENSINFNYNTPISNYEIWNYDIAFYMSPFKIEATIKGNDYQRTANIVSEIQFNDIFCC